MFHTMMMVSLSGRRRLVALLALFILLVGVFPFSIRDFQKLNYPRNDILLQEKFAWRNDDGTDRGSQSAGVEHSQGA